MLRRVIPICHLGLVAIALLALPSCNEDDRAWEIGREAQGGLAQDREQVDEEWGLYRDNVVSSLDLMTDSLQSAIGEGAVYDRKEIGDLKLRVAELRGKMSEQLVHPQASQEEVTATRVRLRGEFESLRTDVDALLTRLGHNPDEIARWQDKR